MEHPRKTSSYASSGTARGREYISPSEIDHSIFTFQAPTPNSRRDDSAPLPRSDETRPRSPVDPSIDHSIYIFSDRTTQSSRAHCLKGDLSQHKLPSDPTIPSASTAVPQHRHKSQSAAATPSSTAGLPRVDHSSHKSQSAAATPSPTAGLPRVDHSSHKSPSSAATPSSTRDLSSHEQWVWDKRLFSVEITLDFLWYFLIRLVKIHWLGDYKHIYSLRVRLSESLLVALQSLFWQNFSHFYYIKQIDYILPLSVQL